MKKILIYAAAALMLISILLGGCSQSSAVGTTDGLTEDSNSETTNNTLLNSMSDDSSGTSSLSALSTAEGSMLDTTELFTERDLEQTADLDEAVYTELVSGEDVVIEEEGVYVISGDVENVTIIVEADDEAKVQLVLDGVSIVNDDAPAIYIASADKVFVTLTDSENYLEVSGEFEADGETNLDAVIYSKSDLTLNGSGSLEIVSAKGNGISTKDDLKITGGTYNISSQMDSLEANDSICIAGGDFTIKTKKDALHSENAEDLSLGYIYVLDGEFDITAGDDGIRGTSIIQIDGGVINIETCTEGIEATYIQINGGEVSIYASDDGINAAAKSDSYNIVIEVNGGTIVLDIGSGDTDAFDSNGNIYINGGTIDITAASAFDPNGTAELNGGTVTVNGQEITEITITQMGGGPGGGMPGGDRPGHR